MVAGDVFEISWTGNWYPDHSMFVDGKSNGVPLLSAHTNARWNYPLSTILSNYPNASWWELRPYGATR